MHISRGLLAFVVVVAVFGGALYCFSQVPGVPKPAEPAQLMSWKILNITGFRADGPGHYQLFSAPTNVKQPLVAHELVADPDTPAPAAVIIADVAGNKPEWAEVESIAVTSDRPERFWRLTVHQHQRPGLASQG